MKRFLLLLVVFSLFTGTAWVPAHAGRMDCAPGCVPSTYPCPSECYEEDSPAGEFILADIFLLRPLGLLSMAVGFTGAVLASPWGCSSCSSHRIQKELLEKPWNYTFARPLGDEEWGNH